LIADRFLAFFQNFGFVTGRQFLRHNLAVAADEKIA
jgi:hypothetical protein